MARKRVGFSLMELMVVVAILAVLAGLVIAKIDYARRDANMAAGALSCGDVAQNIQLYLATTERLPNGLDSLLDTTGALYAGPSGSGGGIIGITDGVGNIPSQTAPLSFTAGDKRLNSLFRVGMSFVNAHSLSASNASDSGVTAQPLGTTSPTGTTLNAATLLCVNGNSSIWNSVFPPNVWGTATGQTMEVNSSGVTVTLVCLGVGPGNSMNGVTMMSPPQYPGPDSNVYYYRYVALFAVYSDGSRAQLKGVIDPYGRTIDSSLQQYSTSGPDNLPPGSRAPE
jgi:prepilin-type N-terminal cleavage/methylation domain-containing protein